LESLFISSEEVKKELPEATQRFVKIDADVKSILAGFKQTQNCVASCSKEGLLKFLEKQQSELEVRKLLHSQLQKHACMSQCSRSLSASPGLPISAATNFQGVLRCDLAQVCEKALADYMESKRRAFPRFYFVSTADLLDILSNGNNPAKVTVTGVEKCLDGLSKPDNCMAWSGSTCRYLTFS
jgi:dynein heavy chain